MGRTVPFSERQPKPQSVPVEDVSAPPKRRKRAVVVPDIPADEPAPSEPEDEEKDAS